MFELHFCWKWNFHSSQNSLRADFRAVLISLSLSSVHFWIGSFFILGYIETWLFLTFYADSWWIGCSHICRLCWLCWFLIGWMGVLCNLESHCSSAFQLLPYLDSKSNSCKLDWSKILSSENIATTKLSLDHFSFLR